MRDRSTSPEGQSGCTCLRLRKASRQVTQIYDQHLLPYGLTVTQFSLLGHLRVMSGVGIGELAQTMVMDPTSLTRALRPLQRQGLVELRPDDKDRRARRLHITAAGTRAFERARPGWRQAQDRIAQVLGADGAPRLDAVLDDLTARLRDGQAKTSTADL